jgi:hypothetical protein
VIPEPGQYVLFSDFMPVGGAPQMIATPLITAGFGSDIGASFPTWYPTSRGEDR